METFAPWRRSSDGGIRDFIYIPFMLKMLSGEIIHLLNDAQCLTNEYGIHFK